MIITESAPASGPAVRTSIDDGCTWFHPGLHIDVGAAPFEV